MPRLPTVGSDDDNWGAILNEYLNFEHKPDGTHNSGIFNVLSFGAKGDGQTDDAPAIQAALNAAASVGGIVWLTPGPVAYRCHGPLYIPPHVILKGAYGGMRRGMREWLDAPRGSLLHVTTQENFIVMSHDSILDGIEIYYPDQVTQGTPTPYGWTINIPANQHGCTIRNITATNPYQFIYANADGFLIDGIQGYPLSVGIQMDRVADVAHINNVQFNPNNWNDCDQSMRDWVNANGITLKIRAADGFMINSFFSYGYYSGIWFEAYPDDPNYPGSAGSINLFGFDGTSSGIIFFDRGVYPYMGVTLSNGWIVPIHGQVGARSGIRFVDTRPGFGPGVSVNNVAIYGPHDHSIWIDKDSYARISVVGGQMAEFINNMVLCMGPNAILRLIGVRSMGGGRPRIYNPGGSDISDVEPITS